MLLGIQRVIKKRRLIINLTKEVGSSHPWPVHKTNHISRSSFSYASMHRNLHLLVILLLSSAGGKDVTLSSVLVDTVLESKLAEGSNHVLDVRVLPVAVLAAELVEPCDAVEQVVDNGDDDCDTNGVSPDDDNGDNVNPAALLELGVVGRRVGLVVLTRHPAEEGKDGSKGVDTENGDNQLE